MPELQLNYVSVHTSVHTQKSEIFALSLVEAENTDNIQCLGRTSLFS